MQVFGYVLLAIIVLAAALRQKDTPGVQVSTIVTTILIIGIAVPTYFIFGQPIYSKLDNSSLLTFTAVSPEQATALRSFEVLKSEDSQSVTLWHDVAVALRLQGAFIKSSYAYDRAAQIAGTADEKASFYGAAGEVLVENTTGNVNREASQLFVKALEQNPATLGALYYLGLSNEAVNKVVAMKHYRNFLRYAQPDHPRLADVNARLFMLSGQATVPEPLKIAPILTAEAIDEFRSLPKDQQTQFLQSMMMRRFNTLEVHGGSAVEWRDLARSFQRLGNLSQARKAYARAIAISPEDASLQLESNQLEP